jgi:magnesium-transporting ATPase (P-type)
MRGDPGRHPRSVDVTELVPGDLVTLQLGEVVAADIRLVETAGLECEESTLTGESLPVAKSADPVPEGTPLAELTCCALMETVVHAGSGTGVVTATGGHAEFGRIALGLGEHQPETAFQVGLRRFSTLLIVVAAALTAAIFAINVALQRPVIDALLFSLAIAVGITPAALVADTAVFARVSPDHKARIVRATRSTGTDVAFLGDGVNDAVALHAADVGISVDSATDVAKDAADVLLLEKDLDVLADGVMEGRRIFANTMKYVLMGTSSNFGNMFSAAGASLFLTFLPMLPSQILLNNLIYDASQLAIPTDNADPEQLARPSRWDVGFIRRFMLFFGPISSLFDFATFGVMLWVFQAGPPLFRTGWFVESLPRRHW